MANDFLAIADLLADGLDLSGTEINDILDAAPLVARMPFVPSSNGTTHKYIRETANPTVNFRAANAGRDFDHSTDLVVTANLGILDWSFAVDKAVADAWKNGGAENLIAREARRHIRAAMAVLETQVINNTVGSNAFTGFAGLTTLDGAADAMVIDAGGTSAGEGSSCYLVHAGEMSGVCGVYKGDGMPIEMGDTIVQNMLDGSSLNYPAYYTPGCSWFGLQVGGSYSLSRIASLTEDSGKGLTDDLISQAISLHPVTHRSNLIVMNRRSLGQLQQSRTATNATGAPAPFPSESFGIPIVVTDAIGNTETLL